MRRFILAVVLVLIGCSTSEDTKLAEQRVVEFHQMLDAGRFEDIYAQAGDDLKKLASQKDFTDLLEAIHRKLGTVKSSTQTSWNVNYDTSGSFITLGYTTEFAGGKAAESFVYRMQNKAPRLVGYHINSNALITK